MKSKMCCLWFSGSHWHPELSSMLFIVSRRMLLDSKKTMAVTGSSYAGELSTKGQRRTLGTFTGIEFSAELLIAGSDVPHKSKFLVSDMELQQEDEQMGVYVWVPYDPNAPDHGSVHYERDEDWWKYE